MPTRTASGRGLRDGFGFPQKSVSVDLPTGARHPVALTSNQKAIPTDVKATPNSSPANAPVIVHGSLRGIFGSFHAKRTPLHRLTKRTETKQKTQGVSGWGLCVCSVGKLVVWVGFGANLPTIRQVPCRYVGLVRGDRPPYGFRRNQGGLFTCVWGSCTPYSTLPHTYVYDEFGFWVVFFVVLKYVLIDGYC